jgi:hypothetical protein
MRLPRAFLLLALSAAACGRSPRAARDGTSAMADTLAAIRARALADPQSDPFENRARADALQRIVSTQSGPMALQNRYLLAQERLLAGQSREAIAQLESLIRDAGLTLDARNARNKPFYDLLAMAWLRLAEQDNCATNTSPNVCILPLDRDARHANQEGARNAIHWYERILRVFPDDRGSMWLLNIAHLAIGGYPGRVPRQYLIPGLDRRLDRAFPVYRNVAPETGLGFTARSGGVSVADFNGDGLLDLFVTSIGLGDAPRLLIADGSGGFVDRADAAGIRRITGGLNNVHADFDNDGHEDLLILRGAWLGDAGTHPMSLLRNRGNGTFEDVTERAGLGSRHPRHSAAWADVNLDGWLDLFVGNESAVANGGTSRRSELFVSNRDGTFAEVSHAAGIDLDAFVKGVAWGDVNNDGLPDLYASVLFGPNRLFVNRGGTSARAWRFEEVPGAAGASLPMMSFPTWFWDADQDGWEDLVALSYDIRQSGSLHEGVALEYLGLPAAIPLADGTAQAVESSRFYRNAGNGSFIDVTAAAGFAGRVIYAMGANHGDLDNDGWFDFYVGTGNPDLRSVIPNRMFRGTRDGRFAEVTLEGGFGHIQKGHGAAFADFDRDGDEDVFMEMGGAYEGDTFFSVLFENPGWARRHWIALELEGRAANRSAIGARVQLFVTEPGARPRTLHRTVGTGGSFGAGPLALHVGLGTATGVDSVRIAWPDAARTVTTHGPLGGGRTWRIVQGALPADVNRPPVAFHRGPMPAPHARP